MLVEIPIPSPPPLKKVDLILTAPPPNSLVMTIVHSAVQEARSNSRVGAPCLARTGTAYTSAPRTACRSGKVGSWGQDTEEDGEGKGIRS